MRYYVYALIDPRQIVPNEIERVFYVGRGTRRRPEGHFAEARQIVGLDTEVVLQGEQEPVGQASPKARRIAELLGLRYTHADIVRVIARDLDEPMARTVESFLLTFGFDQTLLTNQQGGEHASRFRKHGDRAHRDVRENDPPPDGRHYVYALIDPADQKIFYVGKGIGARIHDHFRRARDGLPDADLGEKLDKLRNLLDEGDANIQRILAHGVSEAEAFALESLALKFLVGQALATNVQRGHGAGRFRARGDWERRRGFDLPYVVNAGNGAAARADEMDLYVGEGLGEWLRGAAELVPNQQWSELMLCDAAGLSLFIQVDGAPRPVSVKLFAYNWQGMQVEVRRHGGGTNTAMRDWVDEHCAQLDYSCRRADRVFFPDRWVRNLASTPEEAARRVGLLIEWVRATCREDLERRIGAEGLTELLSVVPSTRRRAGLQH